MRPQATEVGLMDKERETMKVRDVMTRGLDYISAHETVQEASRRMKLLDTTILAVIRKSEAVGMITDRDIVLRVVAPDLDSAATEVAAVMTRGLVVCREEDSLIIAARMMEDRRLRQVVVINREGQLSGMVPIGVLAEHMQTNAALRLLRAVLT
jgi:CBS domain-containing protein